MSSNTQSMRDTIAQQYIADYYRVLDKMPNAKPILRQALDRQLSALGLSDGEIKALIKKSVE